MADDLPSTKVTVLISGEGSNLQALIDASSTRMPYLRIVRVICNKAGANGLNRAKAASIPTTYHNLIAGNYHKSGEKDPVVKAEARERYDSDLASLILADKPDIVVCAGWMHILSPRFLEPLEQGKISIVNIHPALPGKYDGARAIERAYDDYQKGELEHDTTGIMVHYVISEVDRGTPIVVRQIQCRTSETLDELKNRIHAEEHELILEGTRIAISNLWEQRSRSG